MASGPPGAAFIDYLRSLNSDRRPNVVLSIGAPAARFVPKYRAQLFPEVPTRSSNFSLIRAATLLLRRMQMTFPDGDRRTFDLEDVKTNQPLAPGTFAAPR